MRYVRKRVTSISRRRDVIRLRCKYREFKIEIIGRNKTFEYKVYPITHSALKRTKWRGRIQQVIYDPTWTGGVIYALLSAKERINELNHPFWYRK